jgi:hypothetical protein
MLSWLPPSATTGRDHAGEEPTVDRLDVPPVGVAAPTATAVGPLTRDFLAWVARRPRSYAETMDAWRTSCPRFPIWEDALDDGFVRIESGNGIVSRQPLVVLTPRGRAVLDG